MNQKQQNALRNQLGEPILVQVQVATTARAGKCFFNSQDQVDEFGGSIQFGWALIECEGWIGACNHAVWRKPDGTLLDTTPDLDRTCWMSGDSRFFVCDDKATPSQGDRYRAYPQSNRAILVDKSAAKTVRDFRKFEWKAWSRDRRAIQSNDYQSVELARSYRYK